ncbi:uncharacterized protein LOC115622404 [Scaptodrosophila lebanonensis]|uniref:Uncharacterized protein LOC115622404 n=1 Tax=Drosophila lebanonensis TaxID=7225 RepID=A0A6J2TA29_DROLE|nr:uncharacterized protein LOC115622404 [Scaptodrosophila lebanonensis]
MAAKSEQKNSCRNRFRTAVYSNLLTICYVIAACDLLHALFFATRATITVVSRLNKFSMIALLGTMIWVLVVLLLTLGLWKNRPNLVLCWILFSLTGFILDIIFLLWGITSAKTVNWLHIEEYSTLFAGIAIESLCIYLIYRYYMCMDPCRLLDEPETGRKHRKKHPLDEKACREHRKSDFRLIACCRRIRSGKRLGKKARKKGASRGRRIKARKK